MSLLLLISTVLNVHAESLPRAWFQNQLSGQTAVNFYGTTPEGEACILALSDPGVDGAYNVVVYPPREPRTDNDDYIGLKTEAARFTRAPGVFRFDADQDWANRSRYNILTLKLDANGAPIEAAGESDLFKIVCRIHDEIS